MLAEISVIHNSIKQMAKTSKIMTIMSGRSSIVITKCVQNAILTQTKNRLSDI